MENTKLIKKIKEYLDADIKDNNDLDAQAYAEQLMFWIENWEEQKWLIKNQLLVSKNDLKLLVELAEFKEFLDKQKEKSKYRKMVKQSY